MNLRLVETGSGRSVFINIKRNAISLALGETTVYTFDRAGRFVTAYVHGRTYRRGLDNRVLCRWRESGVPSPARKRQWLPDAETRELIEQVNGDVRRVLESLPSEFSRWIQRVAENDYEALRRDAERRPRSAHRSL